MASLVRTGVKIPGRDMVERRARAREPLRKTLGLPLTRSVATQANGVGRSLKLLISEYGSRDLVENEHDLLAGVEAGGKLQAFVQSKLKAVGIIAGIFLAPEREVVKRSQRRQHLVPVDAVHDLAHFGGIVAGGVHPAHQTAHAGAGDVIYRDVMLLHPGNDTDVGEPKRAAAL